MNSIKADQCQRFCLTTWLAVMYSASGVDRATTFFFFKLLVTAPLAILRNYIATCRSPIIAWCPIGIARYSDFDSIWYHLDLHQIILSACDVVPLCLPWLPKWVKNKKHFEVPSKEFSVPRKIIFLALIYMTVPKVYILAMNTSKFEWASIYI